MSQAQSVSRPEFDLASPPAASARLRVLGQELEQKGIADFEVVVESDGYLVRGHVPPPPRSWWTFGGLFKSKTAAVERRYSGSDLDRLNGWYGARRTKTGIPDDYAVSQVLRVVGAYVEARGWVLIGINRTFDLIEITHRDVGEQVRTSVQTYAALFDFAMHMSDNRRATS